MSQFHYQCPRCEFAVTQETDHPTVCVQCGLVVVDSLATATASRSRTIAHVLSSVRPQLVTWCSTSSTGLVAALALRSNALESNVTVGTLAVMGVAWCAPGALRQWNTRWQRSASAQQSFSGEYSAPEHSLREYSLVNLS